MLRWQLGGSVTAGLVIVLSPLFLQAAPPRDSAREAQNRGGRTPPAAAPEPSVRNSLPPRTGQLPPGFEFPVDGTVSDVVQALNRLRELELRGTDPAPAPRVVPPRMAAQPARQPAALPAVSQSSGPPALPPTVVQAAPDREASTANNKKYMYRSYRTQLGGRIIELVERPAEEDATSSVAQRPSRPALKVEASPAQAPATASLEKPITPRAYVTP